MFSQYPSNDRWCSTLGLPTEDGQELNRTASVGTGLLHSRPFNLIYHRLHLWPVPATLMIPWNETLALYRSAACWTNSPGQTKEKKTWIKRHSLQPVRLTMHMTSRWPYWCPKTMKWRPYWTFFMQKNSFVPINLQNLKFEIRTRDILTPLPLPFPMKASLWISGTTKLLKSSFLTFYLLFSQPKEQLVSAAPWRSKR